MVVIKNCPYAIIEGEVMTFWEKWGKNVDGFATKLIHESFVGHVVPDHQISYKCYF